MSQMERNGREIEAGENLADPSEGTFLQIGWNADLAGTFLRIALS